MSILPCFNEYLMLAGPMPFKTITRFSIGLLDEELNEYEKQFTNSMNRVLLTRIKDMTPVIVVGKISGVNYYIPHRTIIDTDLKHHNIPLCWVAAKIVHPKYVDIVHHAQYVNSIAEYMKKIEALLLEITTAAKLIDLAAENIKNKLYRTNFTIDKYRYYKGWLKAIVPEADIGNLKPEIEIGKITLDRCMTKQSQDFIRRMFDRMTIAKMSDFSKHEFYLMRH